MPEDGGKPAKEFLIVAIREMLTDFPGLVYTFTQPIEMRISFFAAVLDSTRVRTP